MQAQIENNNGHAPKGALAVGEVKRWDVELDRFGKDRYDKRRNPSFQMWLYLNETRVNWGILSNGRKCVFTVRTSRLDPNYIVPIHTEARDWFANSFENVVLVDEGRPYEVI